MIVANDATVKAGAWWPETITKILRAQEIAMRNRVPIVYLVDSAGVNLPYQDGIFPGQYGAGRIFFYNSLMRRKLRVPQIAAVMGPCIAGGAYLPALSDIILMVEKTSFMGLGGPNLVKGATGQSTDQESLGGAHLHNAKSGVAHYVAKSDDDCLEMIRTRFRQFPMPDAGPPAVNRRIRRTTSIRVLPADHRLPYKVEDLLARIVDRDDFVEFQAEFAPEMLCANARLNGHPIALIANRRGFLKPRIGGIIYAETARKVAYFVELADRAGTPIIYVQDVSGFMVGTEAGERGHYPRRGRDGGGDVVRECAAHRADNQSCERSGILRDGRPGLRSEFHVQLADGADRRDGRRFGSAGAVFGGTGKAETGGRKYLTNWRESIERTRGRL